MDEKREDHPLSGVFLEWLQSDQRPKMCCLECNSWPAFLAGAEATEERLASPGGTLLAQYVQIDNKLNAIIKLQSRSSPLGELIAKLDKIIRIAETPSLASEAVDELNRMDKRLDIAFGLSHKMAAKLDKILKLAEAGITVSITAQPVK